MKVSVILGHPSTRSFNSAIARTVVKTLRQTEHKVIFHDLYREKFDPVLPNGEKAKDARLPRQIKEHCEQLVHADGLVIVHPNWWGEPPAILKGWVDRVLRVGYAYDFPAGPKGKAGLPIELLKTRIAVILNTSDTPALRENMVLGDPLQILWKNTLSFCGIKKYHRHMYRVVVTSSPARRASWLRDVRKRIKKLFPAD
jgi:NAD(P)H dehydrogenase (quinone)